MSRPLLGSLRARIMAAMFLLALLSSTVLALGVYLASEDLEKTVLSHSMDEESLFLDQAGHEAGSGRHSAHLTVYRQSGGGVPQVLGELATGQHHAVRLNGRDYQVLVRDQGSDRLYLAYDITEWEEKERRILIVLMLGVGLITLLAVPLGYWSSRQIMAPVTALADQVSRRDPRGSPDLLAERFRGQELEGIAEAVDQYSQRLQGFIQREQVFTASASHELRTPLSVLRGALEILEDEPLSDRGSRAAQRMSRAIREMSEYIDALLEIAREEHSAEAGAGTDVADLAERLASDPGLLTSGGAAIHLDLRGPLWIQAPASMPSIVINNLLRNALMYTPREGEVRISLQGSVLSIADTGPGIASDVRDRVFDRGYTTRDGGTGMGLFLARQICERYGWSLSLSFPEAGGTVASIDFSPGG